MGFSTFLKIGDTASGFSQNLANKRVNIEKSLAKKKMAANYFFLRGQYGPIYL